jgi:hypothetical protein
VRFQVIGDDDAGFSVVDNIGRNATVDGLSETEANIFAFGLNAVAERKNLGIQTFDAINGVDYFEPYDGPTEGVAP